MSTSNRYTMNSNHIPSRPIFVPRALEFGHFGDFCFDSRITSVYPLSMVGRISHEYCILLVRCLPNHSINNILFVFNCTFGLRGTALSILMCKICTRHAHHTYVRHCNAIAVEWNVCSVCSVHTPHTAHTYNIVRPLFLSLSFSLTCFN